MAADEPRRPGRTVARTTKFTAAGALATSATRRPGRPRKYDQGRVRATCRFTPEAYARLKQTADNQRRSISEEVEARIERTFQDEGLAPVLKTVIARQARGGTVLAGVLADELRDKGLDASFVDKWVALVKAYFGTEETAS